MASSSPSSSNGGKILKRANPSSIHDKFLVGYQGWFTCGGDGEPVGPGHHGWLHWFNAPIPDGGHPNTDLWPDVSSYSPSELFPAPGLKTKTGEPVFLFSSRNPKTVQRHFHWMAEHGVDGAFLQRFVGQCDLEAGNEGIMRIRDEVGDRVREAAEREGRVFAIMYDVAGVAPDRILRILERDWAHLVRNKGILDSPNYLKEKGKPVVALWGFGFDNAKHTPALVRSIIQFFRNTTPGGVYIMGGTPTSWRTAEGDADRNPEFLNVWLEEFDAISPWTVGRYSNDQEADSFMETKMKGDIELIKHRNEQETGKKIDYIPVVLPGGSGYNMSEGNWGFNNIKRNGGRFLWKQISNAKRLGVRTIYGAMWDEYDEGTAFMPVVEHKRNLPESDKYRFMALDEDGYDVPADWYMRICGFAAEGLRSERRIHETFPVKELQDYWSSRPKYEEVSQKSSDFVSGAGVMGGSTSGSGDGDGQTYQEWLAAQKDEKDQAPPPPYTLVDDEPEPVPAPAVESRPAPAATASAAPAVVAIAPNVSQGSRTNSIPPQPHVEPAPGFNNEAYQSHIGVGSSFHAYQPAAAPSALGSVQSQQPYQPHDPFASLTHDFERQDLSGGPSAGVAAAAAPATASPSDGRIPAGSPPLHPAHPATNADAPYVLASTYPGQQFRPQSQQAARPQPSGGYAPNQGVPLSVSTAPPAQWPPPEWNVNQQPLSSPPAHGPPPTVPHSTHPVSPSSATYPQGHATAGGANLSRPNTFTASSYVGGGASTMRPTASLSHRPSSHVPAGSGHVPSGAFPASEFPAAHPYGSPPHSYGNTSPFPRPVSSSYNNSMGQVPTGFPGPSTPYPPAVSSYPSQGGNSYPGQAGGSAYPPHGSNFAWPGGPANVSPPHSPAASTFPGQSTYNPSRPYSPAQGSNQQHYTGSSFPSNSRPPSASTSPYASSLSFPQMPGGQVYYGNAGNNMPSSDPSQYSSSYGPAGQYVPSSTYPAPGGSFYPSPWTPSSGSGSLMPPANPPGPGSYSSSSQLKPSASPSFPMASSALGYALNAVDKVAGKKTRDQLESQVGSIAQTGTKLFNKFTR